MGISKVRFSIPNQAIILTRSEFYLVFCLAEVIIPEKVAKLQSDRKKKAQKIENSGFFAVQLALALFFFRHKSKNQDTSRNDAQVPIKVLVVGVVKKAVDQYGVARLYNGAIAEHEGEDFIRIITTNGGFVD